MNSKIVALLSLCLSGTAYAQAISGPPYIAVHGEARMEVVPDTFPLSLKIEETSKDTAKTQKAIEAIAKQIVDLTVLQGLADKDVTVGNLSISPDMDYDEDLKQQVFLGNSYEREIKIRFHSLDALRQFLGKLPPAKQLQIDTDAFAYSKADVAKKSLLAEAIRDARSMADEMAKGIGKRISGVHTISNQSFNIRYADSYGVEGVTVMGSGALDVASIVLKEGTITLDQDVYIIFTISD